MGQVGNNAIKVRLQFEVGNVIPLLIASRDISNYISEDKKGRSIRIRIETT